MKKIRQVLFLTLILFCAKDGISNITVKQPYGKLTLHIGEKYIIKWSSSAVSKVKILFSQDGGIGWNVVAEHINASDSLFEWTVPAAHSGSCKILIGNEAVESDFDESDGFFAVEEPNGISEIAQNNFTVYPNPGNGIITILSAKPTVPAIQVSVSDVLGNSIFAADITGYENYSIDLRQYVSNGFYFIEIKYNTTIERKKIQITGY